MKPIVRVVIAVTLAVALLLPLLAIGAKPAEKRDPVKEMLQSVATHQLSNGLKIVMLEDHSAPVITAQFWVKTGSRNERPGITGVSHLFEHMMFRGSTKYGPEEHSRLIKRYGGTDNAYTTQDETVYFETIASDQLELVVHLEAERFANLKLDSAVLKEEKKVVGEERLERTDNNLFGGAFEQLGINFYHSSTYAWPIIGWAQDIQGYSLEDVKEYYRLHYSPNNVVAVIVGDFKAPEAIKLFEKYWGKIPAQPTPPPPVMQELDQRGERRVTYKRQAELPLLMAAYQIPDQTHPDQAALEVLSLVLSGGQSSRLYQRLVYKDKLARFAGGSSDTRIGPSMFIFFLAMKQGKSLDKGEAAMWEEVEKVRNEPITENELNKARMQLEAGIIGSLDKSENRAKLLGAYETGYGSYMKLADDIESLNKVSIADVQRVAKKYLNPDKRTVLTVIPTQDEEETAPDSAKGVK